LLVVARGVALAWPAAAAPAALAIDAALPVLAGGVTGPRSAAARATLAVDAALPVFAGGVALVTAAAATLAVDAALPVFAGGVALVPAAAATAAALAIDAALPVLTGGVALVTAAAATAAALAIDAALPVLTGGIALVTTAAATAAALAIDAALPVLTGGIALVTTAAAATAHAGHLVAALSLRALVALHSTVPVAARRIPAADLVLGTFGVAHRLLTAPVFSAHRSEGRAHESAPLVAPGSAPSVVVAKRRLLGAVGILGALGRRAAPLHLVALEPPGARVALDAAVRNAALLRPADLALFAHLTTTRLPLAAPAAHPAVAVAGAVELVADHRRWTLVARLAAIGSTHRWTPDADLAFFAARLRPTAGLLAADVREVPAIRRGYAVVGVRRHPVVDVRRDPAARATTAVDPLVDGDRGVAVAPADGCLLARKEQGAQHPEIDPHLLSPVVSPEPAACKPRAEPRRSAVVSLAVNVAWRRCPIRLSPRALRRVTASGTWVANGEPPRRGTSDATTMAARAGDPGGCL